MILVFSLVMHRMLCVALSFVFANTSYVILGCWRVAVSTACVPNERDNKISRQFFVSPT